jgi:hypothetical protein
MDLAFFHQLSDEQASEYLTAYLREERKGCQALMTEAAADGVSADFTPDSIPELFRWRPPRIEILVKDPPPDTPDWIIQGVEHYGGFREFTQDSLTLVLRASYYLGQSFVDSNGHLSWATGERDFAEANQPVVTGFRRRANDLPPLTVASNLFKDADSPRFSEYIETAVDRWQSTV